MASGVIIERHFDDRQVSKRAMANNSVGTPQIEQDAVTDGEIAANAVGLSEAKSEITDRLLPHCQRRDRGITKFRSSTATR